MEKSYLCTFQAIQEGLLSVSADGSVISLNPSARKLFGLSTEVGEEGNQNLPSSLKLTDLLLSFDGREDVIATGVFPLTFAKLFVPFV